MIVKKGDCPIVLTVNGQKRSALVQPSDTLLETLRTQLGLTGAKAGCENGDCGACTVMMDGWPVKSCLVLAVEAEGHEILTVEGLSDTPLQKAFIDAHAFQCGFCTSGFLMASYALMQRHPQADEYQMEHWLQSNLCRCTSYAEIRQALRTVMPTTGCQPLPKKGMEK